MQYRGQFWPISHNNILELNDSSRRPTRRGSLILYYKRGFWGYISVVSYSLHCIEAILCGAGKAESICHTESIAQKKAHQRSKSCRVTCPRISQHSQHTYNPNHEGPKKFLPHA
jgi:hypothetical protein